MRCIICLEKCSHKPCICEAYIHKKCLKEWNNSIYNINDDNTCPHCKKIIIIKEKYFKNKKEYIKIKSYNIFNIVKEYILNKNLDLIICLKEIKYFIENVIYTLNNIIIIITFTLLIPILMGGLIYSFNYISTKKEFRGEYYSFIINNIFIIWLLGFIIEMILMSRYEKYKNEGVFCNCEE